jgi:hypothetical protein
MDQEEISLDKYARAVWRAKYLIIGGVLAAAAVAYFVASGQPASHRATAQLRIGRVWDKPIEDPYITERIINSAGFLKEIAPQIGVEAGKLRRAIKAETIIAGPRRSRYPILVNITATTENADRSVELAESVAEQVKARHEALFNDALKPHLEEERFLGERVAQLKTSGAAAPDMVARLESELNEIRAKNTAQNGAGVTQKTDLITEVAPEGAQTPAVWRNVAAAALIAAATLVAAVLLLTYFKPASLRAAAGNRS